MKYFFIGYFVVKQNDSRSYHCGFSMSAEEYPTLKQLQSIALSEANKDTGIQFDIPTIISFSEITKEAYDKLSDESENESFI